MAFSKIFNLAQVGEKTKIARHKMHLFNRGLDVLSESEIKSVLDQVSADSKATVKQLKNRLHEKAGKKGVD